jgi:hypothetical protein
VKAFKDLLYGGRNEYLDVIRVLVLLGGVTFLVLEVLKSAGVVALHEVAFAGAWATMLTASVGAIYARNRSDRRQREQDLSDPRSEGESA